MFIALSVIILRLFIFLSQFELVSRNMSYPNIVVTHRQVSISTDVPSLDPLQRVCLHKASKLMVIVLKRILQPVLGDVRLKIYFHLVEWNKKN